MKQTTYKYLAGTVKAFLILSVLYIIMFTCSCTSCESQSSSARIETERKRMANTPLEKVVILDGDAGNDIEIDTKPGNRRLYQYKVKRISKGVVANIYEYGKYEIGDTIFKKFPNE